MANTLPSLADELGPGNLYELALDTDPDVQALERQKQRALLDAANVYLDRRTWRPFEGAKSQTLLPIPLMMPCDFCGGIHCLASFRWKLMGTHYFAGMVAARGGFACESCYPLSRKELIAVHQKMVKMRQAA